MGEPTRVERPQLPKFASSFSISQLAQQRPAAPASFCGLNKFAANAKVSRRIRQLVPRSWGCHGTSCGPSISQPATRLAPRRFSGMRTIACNRLQSFGVLAVQLQRHSRRRNRNLPMFAKAVRKEERKVKVKLMLKRWVLAYSFPGWVWRCIAHLVML